MVDFQSNEINIAAYDWDLDGKAECVLRGGDGMVIHQADGTRYVVGDPTQNTRNQLGFGGGGHFTRVGAEYLLYLNGETGKPYSVSEYPLKRFEDGETDLEKAWGDGYGHRSNKHFFGAPYLDGRKPSIFLARGIYTRHKMIAYDVDPATHRLVERWRWINNQPGSPWYGQGYHNYSIADVDWDGRDEIVFGSMVIDDNGRGLSTSGLGHGDSHHVGDFNPYVYGQEIVACNEDRPSNNYRDATTSKLYYRVTGSTDDGRAIAGNFSNDYPGAQFITSHDSGSLISTVTNGHIDGASPTNDVAQNFRIYWDGDLLDETFNGQAVRNSAGVIYKFNIYRHPNQQRHQGYSLFPRRHSWRLARGDNTTRRRQQEHTHILYVNTYQLPTVHAASRPTIPQRDGMADERLQPDTTPQLLPGRVGRYYAGSAIANNDQPRGSYRQHRHKP